MIYAFIIFNVTLLAAYIYAARDARVREDDLREHTRHLTDQIVLLKVAPEMAAVQAVPAEEVNAAPSYISAFDDDALADYETDRRQLEATTAALIEREMTS